MDGEEKMEGIREGTMRRNEAKGETKETIVSGTESHLGSKELEINVQTKGDTRSVR